MLRLPKKLPALMPLFAFGLLGIIAFGCGGSPSTSTSSRAKAEAAEAMLHPLASSTVSGTAVLAEEAHGYILTLDAKGLAPTRGASQYALWQLEDPKDRVALQSPEELILLASYRVGASGRLSVEFEPPRRDFEAVPGERLSHFVITRIDSQKRLQESILEFDETGKPPDLGQPVAEGVFKSSPAGAAAPR